MTIEVKQARLEGLLRESARFHRHVCPRQVLGVRMGMLAGRLLSLDLPQADKRLFVFMETDGCASTGVSVATGCWVGRRTMRMMDFGKVGATFVDSKTGDAVRIHPHAQSRQRAIDAYPDERSRWHAQLIGYQTLPDDQLLVARPVTLTVDLGAIISRAGVRVSCAECGEEILNQREVECDGRVVCRACAGGGYYQ